MPCIEAKGLRKTFGDTPALDGIDLSVDEGRILGVIGPNGAGKTTLLDAIVGLIPCEGQLQVLGRDPWKQRERLMLDVCFMADVAVLREQPELAGPVAFRRPSTTWPACILDSTGRRRTASSRGPRSDKRTRSASCRRGW